GYAAAVSNLVVTTSNAGIAKMLLGMDAGGPVINGTNVGFKTARITGYTGNDVSDLSGNPGTSILGTNYFDWLDVSSAVGTVLWGPVLLPTGGLTVSNTVTVSSNLSARALWGNGGPLTNLNGGAVTGAVAQATHSTNADSAITANTATVSRGVTNGLAGSANGGSLALLADYGDGDGQKLTYANLVSVSGNQLVGNGGGLTNLAGGAVVGAVAQATAARKLTNGLAGSANGGSLALLADYGDGDGQKLTYANTISVSASQLTGNGGGLTNILAANYSTNWTLLAQSNHYAGSFTGDGAGLTNLNASNLANGTVPAARAGSFTNHSDVTPSGLAAGNIIAWSGSAWTNGTPASSGSSTGGVAVAAGSGITTATNSGVVTVTATGAGTALNTTVTLGAGAGNANATGSVTGHDNGGTITIYTGTASAPIPAANSSIAYITYGGTYSANRSVVICPGNAAACNLGWVPYVDASGAGGFYIWSAGTALTYGNTYVWNFVSNP
ncbi:MAG: hypothetical protein KGI71_06330, partial [Patescibacteria group bacterium]|nr:hypothetical protein [Patescibacteria group bacterium]